MRRAGGDAGGEVTVDVDVVVDVDEAEVSECVYGVLSLPPSCPRCSIVVLYY